MTQAQLCGKILTGSRDKIIKSAKKYKKAQRLFYLVSYTLLFCCFVSFFSYLLGSEKNVAHKHLKSLEKPKTKTRIGW